MSDFKQLQKQMERRKGQPSWYDRISPELSDERQASLDDALADRSIFHTTISRVLERWGYEVSESQVAHYRRARLAG